MAIYHASTKPIARSAGRSAVAAAAYRAGVELVDARTGLVHDYTRKSGVELAEILTPDGLGVERNALWNAAELAEKRKDARTAREWIVALPSELNAEQRTALTRDFAQCLVERYGVAVDFAIHAPDREGDHRNHHAHLLTTTRQFSRAPDGGLVLGAKAHIELSDKARRERSLGAAADEVKAVRELWEHTANAALERAGVEARIDARSLQAQGIDQEATQHLGPAASEMERRGKASDRGDGNREVSVNNTERARLSAEITDLQVERERREQREAILERAQLRQGYRIDSWEIRERWSFRQQQREAERLLEEHERLEQEERALDDLVAEETAPGVRHPQRTTWREWRAQTLSRKYDPVYSAEMAERDIYCRWMPEDGGLYLRLGKAEVIDQGPLLLAKNGDQDIPLLIETAKGKGWNTLEFTGSPDFQEKAAMAALQAGLSVADTDLAQRARAAIETQGKVRSLNAPEVPRQPKSRSRTPGDDWGPG